MVTYPKGVRIYFTTSIRVPRAHVPAQPTGEFAIFMPYITEKLCELCSWDLFTLTASLDYSTKLLICPSSCDSFFPSQRLWKSPTMLTMCGITCCSRTSQVMSRAFLMHIVLAHPATSSPTSTSILRRKDDNPWMTRTSSKFIGTHPGLIDAETHGDLTRIDDGASEDWNSRPCLETWFGFFKGWVLDDIQTNYRDQHCHKIPANRLRNTFHQNNPQKSKIP